MRTIKRLREIIQRDVFDVEERLHNGEIINKEDVAEDLGYLRACKRFIAVIDKLEE